MTIPARDRALIAFAEAYGRPPLRLFAAPGRVNLIGEHTDYEEGFVLPIAIDRATFVAARPTGDGRIEVFAADPGEADSLELNDAIRRSGQPWANYVRGVAATMIADGHRLSGAQLAIAGDVPQGAGLSSSASLETVVALALASLSEIALEPRALARIGQRAENEFVGCECGIMDQMTAVAGAAGHALLIDCRSLELRPIPLPAEAAIVIAHSGVRHENAAGNYNVRRRQCREAATHCGVAALRDLDENRLQDEAAGLEPVLFRRARHVVSENARVLAAAEALQAGNLAAIAPLMAASQASMRDDFEITTPEVDALAGIMAEVPTGGARMTGGGFGGCVIALTHRSSVGELIDSVSRGYRTPSGAAPQIFICEAGEGARELTL